jgi:hypothetical protein
MLWTSRFHSSYIMGNTMASQTKLVDSIESQQSGMRRTMRRVASDAAFGFHRSMLIHEWALFISVAFNTRCVPTGCQARLLEFEAAVRIVTIAALHHTFENFVMERLGEVWPYLAMTAHTELWLAKLQ